jgi:hypothetical protein
VVGREGGEPGSPLSSAEEMSQSYFRAGFAGPPDSQAFEWSPIRDCRRPFYFRGLHANSPALGAWLAGGNDNQLRE